MYQAMGLDPPESPESEGSEATAAQLLNHSNSSPTRKTTSNNPQDQQDTHETCQSKRPVAMESNFEIVVPTVDHESEYEYLPGHFTVRRILKLDSENPQKPSYTVRLLSGERQTMSFDRLMQLKNSSQALDQFNPDSDSSDDLAMIFRISQRRKLPAFGDDGARSEEEIDPDFHGSTSRRGRRRASKRAEYAQYFRIESDHDSKESDTPESSDDELSAPLAPIKARLRRGGKGRRLSPMDEDSDNNRVTRKSTRKRRDVQKDMRERLEEDFLQAESVSPRRPKYTGAKEVFRELERDDEFRNSHFACCSTCNWYEDDREKGILVFCQGCSSSYHQFCLGPRGSREHLVTKIEEGNFILQCRRCLGSSYEKHDIRPHLGRCAECREEGQMSQPLRPRFTSKEEQQLRIDNEGKDPVTQIDMALVNNPDNVLFRCASCHRAYHAEHLPQMNETGDTDEMDPPSESKRWQCNDCSFAPGEIEMLVAWRPNQSNVDKVEFDLLPELIPEIDKEYLIKWKAKSYFRVTWMRGDWVWGVSSPAMLRAFYNTPRKAIITEEEAIPEENLRVDIVFNVSRAKKLTEDEARNPEMVREAYVKYKGLNYEDSVWEVPPRPDETERWEDFKTAFQDWLRRDKVAPPDRKTLKNHLEDIRELDFGSDLALPEQPEMITGGQLMDYQVEGVNWLYYKHVTQVNAILADDMGLGKTVQVIGLFATLIQRHKCWPFLVVAPNSTVPNWRREIKSWAPEIQVVTYFGSAYARQMACEHEMFPKSGSRLSCHVVIASYESMVDDEAKRVLSRVRWAGLVVDEGQRLKNDRSQLYERLASMKFDFKVLLTGTPLQNNIRELFNLLQFLDPIAHKAEALEEKFGELTSENIRALHKLINPYFLRRTKAEVLPFLPPMVQIIVPVSMSFVQKKLYKSILGKNPMLIKAICSTNASQLKKQEKHNLNNILMQLRKCLCHPFVYSGEIEEVTNDSILDHQRLVQASGKFELLNLMLPKLHARGHRVLIFSQFLENLDLVEDFLTGLKLRYCRLDGRLVARLKQQQIDKFNAPDSPCFAFLLSTRSGGVGINLATADTVIIMDPDFNPKQDMQALSRAHRIGQKNTVLVYHLTTRASVEEKIMEKGKKKLALDHVLIERMEDEEDEEDLESILRHGAQALFENDDSADIHYDSESIDKLLDRSQAENTAERNKDQDSKNSAAQATNPQFNFARVWQKDAGTLEEVTVTEDTPVDETVWAKILNEREDHAREEAFRKAEDFGRGKRKRAQINYQSVHDEANDLEGINSTILSPVKRRRTKATGESDDEFEEKGEVEESDSEHDTAGADDDLDHELQRQRKTHPFKRVHVPEFPPTANLLGLDGTSDPIAPCIACERRHGLGQCPLKGAGVEHCPLCGLAHLGGRRACPHFHSKLQIQRMLEALSRSNESPSLVAAAKRYLRGVIGSLSQVERRESAKKTSLSGNSTPSNQSPAPPASTSANHPPPTHTISEQYKKYPQQADLSGPVTNLARSETSMTLPSLGTFVHQPDRMPLQQTVVSTTTQHPTSLETRPAHHVSPFPRPRWSSSAPRLSPLGTSQAIPLERPAVPPAQQPLASDAGIVDLTGPDEPDNSSTGPSNYLYLNQHNY